MPTTYTDCDEEVFGLVRKIIKRTHPELAEAGVEVNCVFAMNGETAALKHQGYQALAIVKINDLKARQQGLKDATIFLDANAWKDMPGPQQAALIDHELTHLVPMRDKEGEIKKDDLDRPRLRIRLHDYHLGGFLEVAKRHRQASHEHAQMSSAVEKFVQLELPFSIG